MATPLSLYEATLLVSVLVTGGVAAYAWSRRAEPGSVFVVVYAAASVLWSGAELVTSFTGSFAVKADLFLLVFVGVVVSIPAWFLFVLVYTGRWHLVTPRSIAVVCGVPAAAVLLTLTNPLHRLMFAELFPISTGVGLDVALGTAFYPWAAYSLALVVASAVLLADAAFRGRGVFRRQIAVLAVGTVAPAAGSLVRYAGLSPIDLTPVGLAVAGGALAVAISRTGFLDLTPVAGSAVMDTIDAAVFVVDRRDRLVDANAEAVRLLGLEAAPVGQHMTDVLAGNPDVRERYREILEGDVAETELAFGDRRYRVTASPLSDYRGRVLGRVFLVTDVTEQRRREHELTRQNERLDEFASIVSHDLRNPLNVARGRLSMVTDRSDDDDVEAAAEAVRRMEAIVEDVLAIARGGRTVREANREPASLRAVAEAAWASVPGDGARLVVDSDVVVSADPERLQRALENLFRNAVVHAPPADDEGGGRTGAAPAVTVHVGAIDAADGTDGFYVEDDGRGIPEDERPRVLESGYTTAAVGTGFGLAIVSNVVEAHGWSLSVTESADGGARFEVTGPRIGGSERG